MVKKKRILSETTTAIVVEDETEEAQGFADLQATLQEILQNDSILGYIIKDDAKATIDLRDPTKIMEYAMLSSQAFESAEELSTLFNLGDIETILIEGKNAKVLCIDLGEKSVRLFMEKSADHTEILNKIIS